MIIESNFPLSFHIDEGSSEFIKYSKFSFIYFCEIGDWLNHFDAQQSDWMVSNLIVFLSKISLLNYGTSFEDQQRIDDFNQGRNSFSKSSFNEKRNISIGWTISIQLHFFFCIKYRSDSLIQGRLDLIKTFPTKPPGDNPTHCSINGRSLFIWNCKDEFLLFEKIKLGLFRWFL